MSQLATIGRIVHYKLNEQDAAQINKRRRDAHNLNAAGVWSSVDGVTFLRRSFSFRCSSTAMTPSGPAR